VVNGLLTAVIPFDGYARPILFSDGALIGSIVLPANTGADVKLSGLFAGHDAGFQDDSRSPKEQWHGRP
jgi:hypothetical protein